MSDSFAEDSDVELEKVIERIDCMSKGEEFKQHSRSSSSDSSSV